MTESLAIDRLLTEPATIRRLAEFFGVGRNKMAKILARIEGVEKIGGLYRVPLQKMPPSYLIARGCLRPATFQLDAPICTDVHNRYSRRKAKRLR